VRLDRWLYTPRDVGNNDFNLDFVLGSGCRYQLSHALAGIPLLFRDPVNGSIQFVGNRRAKKKEDCETGLIALHAQHNAKNNKLCKLLSINRLCET
jgi:hypothetical protein